MKKRDNFVCFYKRKYIIDFDLQTFANSFLLSLNK